ncbi:MAG: hypothetical protein ABII23_03465 [bacterium]
MKPEESGDRDDSYEIALRIIENGFDWDTFQLYPDECPGIGIWTAYMKTSDGVFPEFTKNRESFDPDEDPVFTMIFAGSILSFFNSNIIQFDINRFAEKHFQDIEHIVDAASLGHYLFDLIAAHKKIDAIEINSSYNWLLVKNPNSVKDIQLFPNEGFNLYQLEQEKKRNKVLSRMPDFIKRFIGFPFAVCAVIIAEITGYSDVSMFFWAGLIIYTVDQLSKWIIQKIFHRERKFTRKESLNYILKIVQLKKYAGILYISKFKSKNSIKVNPLNLILVPVFTFLLCGFPPVVIISAGLLWGSMYSTIQDVFVSGKVINWIYYRSGNAQINITNIANIVSRITTVFLAAFFIFEILKTAFLSITGKIFSMYMPFVVYVPGKESLSKPLTGFETGNRNLLQSQ